MWYFNLSKKNEMELWVQGFRLHLVRDTAAEKEFDIAVYMTLEQVSSEIQENRNARKN